MANCHWANLYSVHITNYDVLQIHKKIFKRRCRSFCGETTLGSARVLQKLIMHTVELNQLHMATKFIQGDPIKTVHFLRSDNFATTNDRKACYTSKISEFCTEWNEFFHVSAVKYFCLIYMNRQYHGFSDIEAGHSTDTRTTKDLAGANRSRSASAASSLQPLAAIHHVRHR